MERTRPLEQPPRDPFHVQRLSRIHPPPALSPRILLRNTLPRAFVVDESVSIVCAEIVTGPMMIVMISLLVGCCAIARAAHICERHCEQERLHGFTSLALDFFHPIRHGQIHTAMKLRSTAHTTAIEVVDFCLRVCEVYRRIQCRAVT